MAFRAMSLPALLLLVVVSRCLHALTPGVLDTPGESNEPNPRYIIAVDTTGRAAQPPIGGKTMRMADVDSRAFDCHIPYLQNKSRDAEPPSQGFQGLQQMLQQKKTPTQLLDKLSGLCLYRIEEWWTFELCYKKHVRQFHKEQNQVISEYSLGTFQEEEVDRDEIKSGDSTGTRASRYISQMYTGGERCEIDGSEAGRMRSTEVRFMCSEDAKESITAIMEPSTCNYLLTVATPRLCKHPDFRLQAGPVGFIVCRPAPEGEAREHPAMTQQVGQEDHAAVQPPKDEL